MRTQQICSPTLMKSVSALQIEPTPGRSTRERHDNRLRGQDFLGFDLSNLELQDSDLGGSNLSESLLGRASPTGTNLEGVLLAERAWSMHR